MIEIQASSVRSLLDTGLDEESTGDGAVDEVTPHDFLLLLIFVPIVVFTALVCFCS